MTSRLEIYKCEVCGNIVEVMHEGKGQLVCCNQPMALVPEKTEDTGREKHVPVAERTEKGLVVKVGSIQHPMEEKHYIEWVEVITDNKVFRKFLNPGETPEAEFEIDSEDFKTREYCNIHGLWTGK